MIVVVLGAGATRGASFVSKTAAACLPPLDTDFFEQLQRTGDESYADLILPIVRNIFGTKQEPSLETAFSALEQSVKLVKAGCMGQPSEALLREYDSAIFLLYKGLQTVFSKSLVEWKPREWAVHRLCDYHLALAKVLSAKDTVLSFNYDCLFDSVIEESFGNKWDPELGYGFNLVSNGPERKKHIDWTSRSNTKVKAPKLLKLHGSMNFDIFKWNDRYLFKLLDGVYGKEPLNPTQSLIFPFSSKAFNDAPFNQLWIAAYEAIQQATEIFVIGYSFPITDSHADMLFRLNVPTVNNLKRLVVVNPDVKARQRARYVLERRISSTTKVIELEYLSELPALLEQRAGWIEMDRFRRKNQQLIIKAQKEHEAKLQEWQKKNEFKDDQT
jgi:hypothetical protein